MEAIGAVMTRAEIMALGESAIASAEQIGKPAATLNAMRARMEEWVTYLAEDASERRILLRGPLSPADKHGVFAEMDRHRQKTFDRIFADA